MWNGDRAHDDNGEPTSFSTGRLFNAFNDYFEGIVLSDAVELQSVGERLETSQGYLMRELAYDAYDLAEMIDDDDDGECSPNLDDYLPTAITAYVHSGLHFDAGLISETAHLCGYDNGWLRDNVAPTSWVLTEMLAVKSDAERDLAVRKGNLALRALGFGNPRLNPFRRRRY